MTGLAEISAEEAQARLMVGEAALIDVRGADEFRAAHIPYAVSLPLGGLGATIAAGGLPAKTMLIFQCARGARSVEACRIAAAAGSEAEVRSLRGGIEGWRAAKLPLIGNAGVSIFRQVQITVGLLVLATTLAGLAGVTGAFYFAAFFGAMLAFAGISGWCGLAMLLARMPWNRPTGLSA